MSRKRRRQIAPRKQVEEVDDSILEQLKNQSDPESTGKVGPIAGAANAPMQRKAGAPVERPKPKKVKEIQVPIAKMNSTVEKKIQNFAEGMGIISMQYNQETNSISFELEEEFYHTLNTISSWKKIQPEVYLSKLLTEYFLIQKKYN